MRKHIAIFSLIPFLMGIIFSLPIYAQNSFVRGVYLFGITNVDYAVMRDSLYLNWVQGIAEDENGTLHNSLLQNNGNLNVIGIFMKDIYYRSNAQRMVYEAWRTPIIDSTLYNYFSSHPVGVINSADSSWYVAKNTSGYMVQNPVPVNQYHYGKTNYVASFVLKRTPASSGNPKVVRLEIWHNNEVTDSISVYNNEFSGSNLLTKNLNFSVSSDNSVIDIRVYSYGNVATWLYKVIVQDSLGLNLFSGNYDAAISNSASGFTTYPLVRRFYLYDEPQINIFSAYKYIQNHIGGDTCITTVPQYTNRFLQDAQPNELLVDIYPIRCDISSPSIKTDPEAVSLGITAYTTNADYTGQLQSSIERYLLRNNLRAVATLCSTSKKDFWYVPQLHGEYFEKNGKFRRPDLNLPDSETISLRPPTGNEVKLLCNLGIAYGAKGIFPYTYGTEHILWSTAYGYADFAGLVSTTLSGTLCKDHYTNYGSFTDLTTGGTKSVRMGYKEKWDAVASVMKYYAHIDSTILLSSLTWQGTKSWNCDSIAGTWSGVISGVTSGTDAIPYIETGVFKNNGLDYLFVVNRLTDTTDQRNITIAINESYKDYNYCKITEVGTTKIWVIEKTGSFYTGYQPGEGKLFKLEPSMTASIRSSKIPQNDSSNSATTYVAKEELPTTYAMEQNYPNPFNPSTEINYQMPKDGFVSLKVYDILGRDVRTLVNGYRTAGKYSVSFNASSLASGIYIYQLKSNGFSSLKKMILTK